MRLPPASLLALAAAVLLVAPVRAVEIAWVTVGDPGNECDPQPPRCCNSFSGGCFGSVAYTYRIGRFEVTNAQYTEFLNAKAAADPLGLYDPGMETGPLPSITRSGTPGNYTYSVDPGRDTHPVGYVNFYDALRFTNWLNNGQGGGDTETGAYTLLGGTAVPSNGPTVTRNIGAATVFLASEDEWYKAAYYEAAAASYNPYPFADGFFGAACEVPPGSTDHSANCFGAVGGTTEVGVYSTSPSAYGTFDQGGNIWEWNEAASGSLRGLRGGELNQGAGQQAASVGAGGGAGTSSSVTIGFRVASLLGPTDCNDSIDNDGDGLVDNDDPGCAASNGASELPRNDVHIDVVPFSSRNKVLAQPYWAFSVAVLASGTVNVNLVDPDTLAFGPAGADPIFDLTNPWIYYLSVFDVNDDGFDDLVSTYFYGEAGLPLGASEACLTGEIDGVPFQGCDTVKAFLPACGLGFELALLLPPVMWLRGRRRRLN